MMPVVDLVPARRVVLRVFDHLDEFRWMPRSIYALIRRYLDSVDLVVASARDLVRRLEEQGIEAAHVPNGAHLRETDAESPSVAPAQRVVYVGAIDSGFDLDTVETWAAGLPDARFEIAGPNRAGYESSYPNLVFLGPWPYDQLGDLIRGARFGLIPFEVGPLTRGVHPLKLYDYLWFGCPVLSAALPEVEPDERGIFVYREPREGLDILREHWDREFDAGVLRSIAVANGWGERLRTVFDLLDEPLETT
jgi:hypothetical protein